MTGQERTKPSTPAIVGWLLFFTATLVLYVSTSSRGAQWQDHGWMTLRAMTGEVTHPYGLALSHPLHHWLCRFSLWALPVKPAIAATMVSCVAAAVAVANVFGAVRSLSGRTGAAIFAATALAMAHTFWRMATVVESYTVAAALLSAECWLLVVCAQSKKPKWLLWLPLVNGLAVSNHLLGLLTTPVLAVVVLRAWHTGAVRWSRVCAAAACWVLGTMLYLVLILAALARQGDVVAVVRSALFGNSYAEAVLNTVPSARLLIASGAFTLLSFPNLLVPLAVYGLYRALRDRRKPTVWWALPIMLIVHLAFAIRYDVADQYIFFIPSYVVLVVLGGWGLALAMERLRPAGRKVVAVVSVLLFVVTPFLYAVTPALARRAHALDGVTRNKPYRDDYTYLFTPWSIAERSADRLSDDAMRLAGTCGVIIVEDHMASFAVKYKAILAGREGCVLNRKDAERKLWREAYEAGCPVVLVPKVRGQARVDAPGHIWRPVGQLFVAKKP